MNNTPRQQETPAWVQDAWNVLQIVLSLVFTLRGLRERYWASTASDATNAN